MKHTTQEFGMRKDKRMQKKKNLNFAFPKFVEAEIKVKKNGERGREEGVEWTEEMKRARGRRLRKKVAYFRLATQAALIAVGPVCGGEAGPGLFSAPPHPPPPPP